SRASNSRHDLAGFDSSRCLEDTADDAFLTPELALGELAVGQQAGDLRAGASAARRAIVSLPRAEYEVLAIGARHGRWAEELDVIDLRAGVPRHALRREGLANPPGDFGQAIDMGKLERLTVLGDEKEPVASPGHVADISSQPWHVDRHILGASVTC